MTSELAKRRGVYGLGERAIQYYTDTGLCVFCEADDTEGIPHEEDCHVGKYSGIVVDADRIELKLGQRKALFEFLQEKAGEK